jgi:serine/threonine protein kinase
MHLCSSRNFNLCFWYLDKRGHVKLIDFGFAKDINETKQTFTLCGTPEYLAPEILQGSGYGQSSDWCVFSNTAPSRA